MLIIEWLGEERKTGADLTERIRRWSSPVEHRPCERAKDVLTALDDASKRIRVHGEVPVIHLEAHGHYAPNSGEPSGLCGPDGRGDEELLEWTTMTPLLGQINAASQFQVLVVGAACHGLTALDAFNVNSPAPFSAHVAFGTEVHERRLFECMVELYRQLLTKMHRSIPEATQVANLELNLSEGEMLIAASFHAFARQVIEGIAEEQLEPNYQLQNCSRLALLASVNNGTRFDLEAMRRIQNLALLDGCVRAVNTWFAYDILPQNRQRFDIDVPTIFSRWQQKYRARI